MLVLVLINENGSVTGTTLCCSLDQVESEEFYPTRESADESITTDDLTEIAENFTSQENAPLEVKPNQTSRLCGSTEVTNVYERKHDIDMRYVQDSITALWRIIFFLIFILILLVFLISYVSSLIRRSNSKGCSPSRTKMYAEVGKFFSYRCHVPRYLLDINTV